MAAWAWVVVQEVVRVRVTLVAWVAWVAWVAMVAVPVMAAKAKEVHLVEVVFSWVGGGARVVMEAPLVVVDLEEATLVGAVVGAAAWVGAVVEAPVAMPVAC